MEKIRKLIYLLQLEEYNTERFLNWLSKNSIEDLKEKKNHLKITLRVLLTFFLTSLLLPFTKDEKAVAIANMINKRIFQLIEGLIFLAAKIKISLYPDLKRIVITGSYGKTTFKELLSFVLQEKFNVIKTEENINTKIGIASLILKKLNKKHEIFIVEAGAYQKGEIRKICELVKPDFGVITIFGIMHLERFGSIKAIKEAKSEVIPFIKDRNKLFVPQELNKFIDFEKSIVKIGKILGLKESEIISRMKKFKNPSHRLEEKAINSKITILDDTYNSNPLGFERALEKLKDFKNRQKIVVTPGIIELGKKQYEVNYEMGKKAAMVADALIIVGKTNRQAIFKGAQKGKKKKTKIITIGKDENVEEIIPKIIRPPAVILLENELPDHYF